MINVTKSNLNEVMGTDKLVLLDFWAPWCAPCVALAPTLEEIAKEADYVQIGKINVDEEPEIAAEFGAMSIPLLVLLKNGSMLEHVVGVVSKNEILAMIKKHV